MGTQCVSVFKEGQWEEYKVLGGRGQFEMMNVHTSTVYLSLLLVTTKPTKGGGGGGGRLHLNLPPKCTRSYVIVLE